MLPNKPAMPRKSYASGLQTIDMSQFEKLMENCFSYCDIDSIKYVIAWFGTVIACGRIFPDDGARLVSFICKKIATMRDESQPEIAKHVFGEIEIHDRSWLRELSEEGKMHLKAGFSALDKPFLASCKKDIDYILSIIQ
jgi:hypothetical protein